MAEYPVRLAGGIYSVDISDSIDMDPERAQVVLDTYAWTLANGGALVVPMPMGFPAEAMPEVAARVAFMLRQYVELYAPKEPEAEKEPAQT